MKDKLVISGHVGMALLALTAFAAVAEEVPWGWAYGQGRELEPLVCRSASEGAVLTNAALCADADEIRFASGDVKVARIDLDGRNIRFSGHSDGTTRLVQDAQSVCERGGAIRVTGGSVVVTNLTFAGFAVEGAGGALSLEKLEGDSAVVGCSFVDCRSTDAWGNGGGAIYASGKDGMAVTLSVRSCSFESCSALSGGAIDCVRVVDDEESTVSLVVAGSSFVGNMAFSSGGAILTEGDLTLTNTLFEANAAAADGGAICVAEDPEGSASVVRCLAGVVFSGNAANGSVYDSPKGGAIALMDFGVSLFAERTAFLANEASLAGGAIFAWGEDSVVVSTGIFSNNTVSAANGFGGAIAAERSSCALTNVTIRGSSGNAVDVYETEASFVNCVILDNGGLDVNFVRKGDGTAKLSAARSAFGTVSCVPGTAAVTNECFLGRSKADYAGDSLRLCGIPYNPVAAEGLVQEATDFDGVRYGSLDYGHSMGAFECATESCVFGESATFLYDGKGHACTFSSSNVLLSVSWTYSETGGEPWSPVQPTFTRSGTHPTYAIARIEGFNAITNLQTVTITNRSVKLFSASASKPYDGVALTTNDVWAVGTGDSGLVEGDGLSFDCRGSQTVVGTNDNFFVCSITNGLGETVTDCYDVTCVTGRLVVMTARLPDPDPSDPDDPQYPGAGPHDGPDLPPDTPLPPAQTNGIPVRLSNYDQTHVYDGAAHTFDTNALIAKLEALKPGGFHGNAYTVDYSLSGAAESWTNEPYAFTNVLETPTSFWYRVSVPNFTNCIHAVSVVITQCTATVTANSATKTYDGLPLTEAGWTDGGFAPGEGVARAETSGSITDVGVVSNRLTSVVYNERTLLSNYVVITNQGELAVTPYIGATVTVQGNTNTVVYTGFGQETEGWAFVSSSTNILTAASVVLKAGRIARAAGTNACATAYRMGLTADDFACTSRNFENVNFIVRDGGLKIDPMEFSAETVSAAGPTDRAYSGVAQMPTDVVLSNKVLNVLLEPGRDYVIDRYEDNTNVTTSARVVLTGVGNYTNEFAATFAITPLTLTVRAKDQTIAFDEAPAPFDRAITGFVKDEASREAELVRGTVKYVCDYAVGKPVGTYDIAVDVSGLSARNYLFKPEKGRLTVTSAALRYTATPVNAPYDGRSHAIGLEVKAPVAGVTTNFATCAEGPWQEVTGLPAYVAVTNTTLWYSLSAPNYDSVTGSVSVVISPRPVTITSPTWTNEYTGVGMSFTANDLVIGGSLMAPGEEFVLSNFAAITNVGSVTASFDVFDGTAKTNNYAITRVFGRLTVVSTNQLLVAARGGEWAYDATEHTANECTVVNPAVLRNGDRFVALGYSGAITNPGTATNEITKWDIVSASGVSVRDNYLPPLLEPGELIVRRATFAPTAEPYAGTYDGRSHGIRVDAGSTVGGVTATVGYSRTKEGPFDETDPAKVSYAGVTNGVVWFRVTAEPAYYEPCVGCASVDISPLEVEFWSTNATTKVPPLGTDLDFVRKSMKVANAENRLPAGESLVPVNRAELTAVGTCDAAFGIVAGNGDTDLRNYTITPHFGRLSVLAPEGITLVAKSGVFAFNGLTNALPEIDRELSDVSALSEGETVVWRFSDESRVRLPSEGVVSNVISSAWIMRGGEDVSDEFSITLLPGFLSVTNIPMTGVTAVSTNVVYDGGDYSIGVKVPTGLLSTPKVTYSRNGAPGSFGANPTFRHYADEPNVVFYWVEADGYDTVAGEAFVQIRQRPASLVSEGATHVFDGFEFSHRQAAVAPETPLVQGDVLETSWFTVVTNVTDVGGVRNRFGFSIVNPGEPGADLTKDYDISYDYGRLVVSRRPVRIGFSVASPRQYDGTTNAVLVATNVTGAVTGDALAFDPTGMEFYFRNPNVGTQEVFAVGYDDARVSYIGTNPVGKDNYLLEFVPTNTAVISPVDISQGGGGVILVVDTPSCVYSGGPQRPTDFVLSNKVLGVALVFGKDYVFEGYGNNTYVTDAAAVSIRGVGNYANILSATFSITPRPITVRANAQQVGIGNPASLLPGFDSPKAWGDATAGLADSGLATGDGLRLVKLCISNSNWQTEYEIGTYTNEIVLTDWKGTVHADDGRIVITNASGDVTSNYTLSFLPGDLEVVLNLSLFKATMKWKYLSSTGNFLAQINVVNTNRTDLFDFTPGSMRFCFADRVDAKLGDIKLWSNWKPKGPVAKTEVFDGVTYRVFALADPGAGERGGWSRDMKKTYGPRDGVSYTVKQLADLNKEAPAIGVASRTAPLMRFPGYLVWESGCDKQGKPIVQSLLLVAENELADPEAVRQTASLVRMAEMVSSAGASAPVSLDKANLAAALGVPYESAGEPTCRLVGFSVTDDAFIGRVETSNGVVSGVPNGANALVQILYTSDLSGGSWERRTLEPTEIGEDGVFEIKKPTGGRFFKVSVGVRQDAAYVFE